MNTAIHMHTHVCIHTCTSIHTCVHTCMHIYTPLQKEKNVNKTKDESYSHSTPWLCSCRLTFELSIGPRILQLGETNTPRRVIIC